ncbi:hypothetical protein DPMN_025919 [Dreissena polymorpha]|uniref:Uncharacterized protein n=1 Tax=Dreissena polymorpha TaxID=45954 RepID=A0A9D4LS94_DREPO|nr:hypothetical protein DPMN_025919 [Dreissena polymorpha]
MIKAILCVPPRDLVEMIERLMTSVPLIADHCPLSLMFHLVLTPVNQLGKLIVAGAEGQVSAKSLGRHIQCDDVPVVGIHTARSGADSKNDNSFYAICYCHVLSKI